MTIPSEQDILMPRDRILVLISEDSELEDLSDSLGIPKEITSERNIKRLMIAGTSRIALNLARQVHEILSTKILKFMLPNRIQSLPKRPVQNFLKA